MPKLNNPLCDIDAETIARVNAERVIDLARYQEEGAEDRIDYFLNLYHHYGVDVEITIMLADMLGPDEDFDGLITTIEDGFEEGIAMVADLSNREARA